MAAGWVGAVVSGGLGLVDDAWYSHEEREADRLTKGQQEIDRDRLQYDKLALSQSGYLAELSAANQQRMAVVALMGLGVLVLGGVAVAAVARG